MTRPITLFTGQWADLPFEEVCRLAVGVGLRRARDRLLGRPPRPVAGRPRTTATSQAQARHAREARAEGLGDLQPPQGPGRLRRPDRRSATRRSCPRSVWGDGDPEGVRQRAAEEMKMTARAAREARRRRPSSASPARRSGSTSRCSRRCPQAMIDAGYQDFADRWNPILDVFDEVRRAVRPRGAPVARSPTTTGPPCATLEAIGHREAFGLNWDPSHFVWQDLDPVGVPLGLQGPDLPRRLQGREAAGRQRPQRPARLAPGLGRPAPRLGLRLHRPRRRALGGSASGCSTRSATTARSRSSGRTPGMDRLRRRRRRPGVRAPAGLRRAEPRPSTRRSLQRRSFPFSTIAIHPPARARIGPREVGELQ